MQQNVAAVLERLAQTPMLGFDVTRSGPAATVTVKMGSKVGLKPAGRPQTAAR